MKLIVGLGNPGAKYKETRHNVGFEAIDIVAEKLSISLDQSKFKGVYGTGVQGGEKVFLLKPLTFMNLSGESVKPLLDYFSIKPEDVLVIYDDLDLEPGSLRLRQKGGHGGHNGMKSLINHLGTKDFKRIRIGVGRPEAGASITSHVLGKFPPEEKEAVKEAIEKSAEAAALWTKEDFASVMNEFNRKEGV
ncbi:aminoacyl-tRNA hydrolase [Bacillus sp. FJAT-44742]|uniref:aminoacyl-tRNA hydrolase n=1 Tax=Bacillus sp. FJAT-44742 TaxID=2014005 RepID=UPI000C240FF7|nr:aminoacyl-tRNA hydrolase [Bacillus sp. FJAT-44742]